MGVVGREVAEAQDSAGPQARMPDGSLSTPARSGGQEVTRDPLHGHDEEAKEGRGWIGFLEALRVKLTDWGGGSGGERGRGSSWDRSAATGPGTGRLHLAGGEGEHGWQQRGGAKMQRGEEQSIAQAEESEVQRDEREIAAREMKVVGMVREMIIHSPTVIILRCIRRERMRWI